MAVLLWQDPSDHNEPRIQEKLSLRRPSLPQRSLRHYLTREKVPSETNYRWVRVTDKENIARIHQLVFHFDHFIYKNMFVI